MTGRKLRALHTFHALDDASCLAFFEVPDTRFEFKAQEDFDLHIALEVSRDDLHAMLEKARRSGIEARGISDHGFVESIYFRDPSEHSSMGGGSALEGRFSVHQVAVWLQESIDAQERDVTAAQLGVYAGLRSALGDHCAAWH